MSVYYNDNEPFIGGWLAELVKAGELPDGDLDNASIRDIKGSNLADYTECHFFAGIGGWPLALRLAGWPADRPVWTGSCPCQPFSAAGKRGGTSDERHLWPEFLRLISECRPPTIFGEQVASKDGRLWLARVRADLEALGYAVGAADLCAAGVGAPHIRQRLWWVADSNGGLTGDGHLQPSGQHGQQSQDGRVAFRMDDTTIPRRTRERFSGAVEAPRNEARLLKPTGPSSFSGLADAECSERWTEAEGRHAIDWTDAGWKETSSWNGTNCFIDCADGKARRVEPSIQPLAHGVPNRVGTLRGAGNAINPILAEQFIRAFLDA